MSILVVFSARFHEGALDKALFFMSTILQTVKQRVRGVPPSVQTLDVLYFFVENTGHSRKKEVIQLVTINGEQKDCAGMTVLSLLSSMNLDPKRSAVMIRGEIVPKAEYDRPLSDGDDVDIVGFVGGG